jgi:KipI family sensor histidine kinase inhibitor
MNVSLLGDTAVVVTLAGEIGPELAGRVAGVALALRREAQTGVVDVVPAFRTVTVVLAEESVPRQGEVAAWVRQVMQTAVVAAVSTPREVEIPVCYGGSEGPDLTELAAAKGLSEAEVVSLHSGDDYFVHAIGFAPGFPYLGGLPPALATPRRSTPRPLVPAGTVGIGGGQTGVYPFSTPGGWNLIGRTPARLFDADRPEPALLSVGDRVRFRPVSVADLPAPEPKATAQRPSTGRGITVVRPGLHSSIQDLGRPGRRHEGITAGGAADAFSLRLLNQLVGNDEHAAGLEFTLVGPTLRFECDAVVAVGGAPTSALPRWQPTWVARGTTVDFGPVTAGCRGYLAVAGGIDVPVVLGGRGLHLRAGFGGGEGRLLAAGDSIALGAMGRDVTGGGWHLDERMLPWHQESGVLRVLPDEDGTGFHAAAWTASYQVSAKSDRMGLRLIGPALTESKREERLSSAVVPGTIQVPPDGQPIILMVDAQTIGGYPRLGQVIAADLPKVAQLRPGQRVQFQPVDRDEATRALAARERALALARQGIAGKRRQS